MDLQESVFSPKPGFPNQQAARVKPGGFSFFLNTLPR
jgi:hypothetical protein